MNRNRIRGSRGGFGSAVLLLLDVVLVVTFAAIGRASHDQAQPVLDALDTAWPFLVGTATGWVVAYFNWDRTVPVTLRAGVAVWICTVCIGMSLRHLMSMGTAFSFIVVASLVLGAFLLGWRLVRHLLVDARRRRSISNRTASTGR